MCVVAVRSPRPNSKLNDIKREGRLGRNVDDDYTNLYRYAATLKKEDKLDGEERKGVEQSVVGAKQNIAAVEKPLFLC